MTKDDHVAYVEDDGGQDAEEDLMLQLALYRNVQRYRTWRVPHAFASYGKHSRMVVIPILNGTVFVRKRIAEQLQNVVWDIR